MKTPVFTGSCTALITPFTESGVDEARMRKLLDFQRENGTSAVVLAGTTGENATLDLREYERLVEQSVRHVGGSMKLIAGVGGNNTAACLSKARFAQSAGADAVLMCPPYYNKTTQAGLLRHFLTVADAVDIPLILYNVPSRTVLGILPETYVELAKHPNINGVKEASGDFSLFARITAECGDDLNLWCGNDDQTVPMMAMGAQGVISVASNVVPAVVAKLCALCRAGDFAAARALSAEYEEFFRLLFVETNPIPVKAAMSLLDLDSGLLRLPLVDISAKNQELLKQNMIKIGLLD